MSARPIIFDWTGTAMVPRRPFMRDADARFVIGEGYMLEPVELRSAASHRHYFAVVNDAWASLPNELLVRFPSPDHLRKWALIKAGFCDMRHITCASKAEALRVGEFVRPCDSYALVTVKDAVVTIYTAHSQSNRSMDKKTFAASKEAVLRVVGDLLERKAA